MNLWLQALVIAVSAGLACAQSNPGGRGSGRYNRTIPASYLLGAERPFSFIVDQLQDNFTDKTFRIDGEGDVTIPLIGRVHAGGMTASEPKNS